MKKCWKHLLLIILALLLLIGTLAGCGQEKQELPSLPEELPPPPPPPEEPEPEPVHEHHYRKSMKVPNCYEGGYTDYTCECGDTYRVPGAQPIGHSYTDEVFPPTYVDEGYTVHTCAFCGHSYEDTYVEVLPDGIEDGTFFNDAVFIGDSVVVALKNYVAVGGDFGEALFLCRPSYSARHAVDRTMYLTYRGRNVTVPEALTISEAKKVFIMLGMNDVGVIGYEKSMEYMEKLIASVREACPELQIFFMACTPIYVSGQTGWLTNANMDAYNELLKTYAEENGCFYIDTATPMKDPYGGLIGEYSSDMYVHLNEKGCRLWTRILKDFLLEHKGELK